MYRMTPVPNEVFDKYLCELQPGELKVLLVVVRQTLGYAQGKQSKKRKVRDWISSSQLEAKTGYSRRTISTAIDQLVKRGLIRVMLCSGESVTTPNDRRGKRLYFQLTLRQAVDKVRLVKKGDMTYAVYSQGL